MLMFKKNHMKYFNYIVFLFCACMALTSCEPRIKFDEGQWGDHAIITGVRLFTIVGEEHELQEFYESGILTPGLKRQFISIDDVISSFDAEKMSGEPKIVVTVGNDVDLTKVGIVIRHEAKKIVEVKGAPRAGFVSDFSKGPFYYNAVSADGTVREWEISFVQGAS